MSSPLLAAAMHRDSPSIAWHATSIAIGIAFWIAMTAVYAVVEANERVGGETDVRTERRL